ncbi:GH25 family lysozyme [Streptomyces sp. NPDC051578]|uniref:GH25 family lysozyme n=1 Tax=Streptomyces sp. NPDC051578 TaxID=3365662 RepID=UPI0037A683ED
MFDRDRQAHGTLPGALDLQAGCHGLSQSAMVNWIRDFGNTYHARTSRFPVIETTISWWQQCTGNNASFGQDYPLWIDRWASTPGALPSGWSYYSFWEYADHGPYPGDQLRFNGDAAELARLASG